MQKMNNTDAEKNCNKTGSTVPAIQFKAELELNRGWIYGNGDEEDATGERNFIVSKEYFLSVFSELFPDVEDYETFLDVYIPETDGEKIYRRAKADGMIIEEHDSLIENQSETSHGSAIPQYTTLKLSWEQVAQYLGNLISALLGRTIRCSTQNEDLDYWSISAIKDSFSSSEIITLIKYVDGDQSMYIGNLPDDSNFSRSIDMDLCQALLKKALVLEWEVEMPRKDALWITGHFPYLSKTPALPQNLLWVDDRLIDCKDLITRKEFVNRLFSDGGTYMALTDICEENFRKWHSPLYWTYPISDSLHTGCYFVLVKDGVLVLAYDKIGEYLHEEFIESSTHMCTAEEMQFLIDEWTHYSNDLLSNMEALHAYLCRLEVGA